mgnify:CR=1 FL=1
MGLISGGSGKKSSSGARSVKISIWRRIVMFFVANLQQGIGSLGELSRTPWASLMTIAVLGLSLTLPATLYVVVKNAQLATGEWDQAAEISLFLRKDLQTQELQSFRERVRLMNEVESVQLIDRETGLREFRESSGFGSAIDYLQTNPLPDVLIVVPVSEFRSYERAQRLLTVLEREREVSSARLDLQWLQRLQAIVRVVENSLAALAILLSLAVVLIVGNTIRLAILNRRDEIMIMKLVGATNAYIQRPFLYTGFWYGVIGGVIAWISTTLMVWWISASVAQLTALYDSSFRLAGLGFNEMMVLWLVAIILGLLGSWIAVRRHVAAIEPT